MKAYVVFSVIICGVLSDGSNFKAFKQHRSIITAERFEISHYNKNLFTHASAVTFKYNRSTTAINLTFSAIVEIGYDMQLVIQFYKFMSNEYRQFPLRFQINVCDALKEDAFGIGQASKCGNFKGCPLKKDMNYLVCNFVMDGSKFPPLIPNGNYKGEIQGFYRGTELGIFNAYISIQPPPPKISN